LSRRGRAWFAVACVLAALWTPGAARAQADGTWTRLPPPRVPPNQGIAEKNFHGQIIMARYQPPTRANAPDAILSQ